MMSYPSCSDPGLRFYVRYRDDAFDEERSYTYPREEDDQSHINRKITVSDSQQLIIWQSSFELTVANRSARKKEGEIFGKHFLLSSLPGLLFVLISELFIKLFCFHKKITSIQEECKHSSFSMVSSLIVSSTGY